MCCKVITEKNRPYLSLQPAGLISADSRIVCELTGHGLKDSNIVEKPSPQPLVIPVNLDAEVKAIGI